MKKLFIECYEAAISRYLEFHPNASVQEADDATCGEAYEKMQDKYHDMADRDLEEIKW